MENLFIRNLHLKSVDKFTSDIGLKLRKKYDPIIKKVANKLSNTNIIRLDKPYKNMSDDAYFNSINHNYIPLETYDLKKDKNNIVVERYPALDKNESYIFVSNHTCPEDIESVLSVLDRNAYLLLGSIDSLKNNREMYPLFINGMIPFDILDQSQRNDVMAKMERVIKTNSILMFPEGSHNFSPNKLVNNLFDGATNLALKSKKKIVVVTFIKDPNENVSYIDLSNPMDLDKISLNSNINFSDNKTRIKYLTKLIRDKMASGVYNIISRHIEPVRRDDYDNIEEEFRKKKIKDSFAKLHWNKDVFDAEFYTKKTKEESLHNEIITTLGNIKYDANNIKNFINIRAYYGELLRDLHNKDVVIRMREHLKETESNKVK